MPSRSNETGAIVLALLLVVISLICVLMAWRLLRAWQRHDARLRSPRRGPLPTSIWQASGDRLISRLNRSRPWNRRQPPPDG